MQLELPAVHGLSGVKCLVTGGAGFIGSSLTRILEAAGATVTVYDNFATGSRENLHAGTTFAYGDIRDSEKLQRILPGQDIVYHLACLGVRHSIHSPLENHEVNARGALTLLTAARAADVKRFVHVSTSEVYGTARTVPMTEEHPTDPHTVYGGSKLAGECYARAFFRCYGFETVVIRPFNSYGPRSHHEGDSGEVLPRFIIRALLGQSLMIFGDGAQTRDLTHVYDTAAAIARAGVAEGVAGETLNIGAGREVTISELARMVISITGSRSAIEHIEARPGDVRRLLADSSRGMRLLAHTNQISLPEGISDLVVRVRARGPESIGEMGQRIVMRNWQ